MKADRLHSVTADIFTVIIYSRMATKQKTFTCGEAGEHVLQLHLKKAQIQSSLHFPLHLQTYKQKGQRSQARNHNLRTRKGKEAVIYVICVDCKD